MRLPFIVPLPCKVSFVLKSLREYPQKLASAAQRGDGRSRIPRHPGAIDPRVRRSPFAVLKINSAASRCPHCKLSFCLTFSGCSGLSRLRRRVIVDHISMSIAAPTTPIHFTKRGDGSGMPGSSLCRLIAPLCEHSALLLKFLGRQA